MAKCLEMSNFCSPLFFLGDLEKTSPVDLGLTVFFVTVFYFVQFFFGDVLESGATYKKGKTLCVQGQRAKKGKKPFVDLPKHFLSLHPTDDAEKETSGRIAAG